MDKRIAFIAAAAWCEHHSDTLPVGRKFSGQQAFELGIMQRPDLQVIKNDSAAMIDLLRNLAVTSLDSNANNEPVETQNGQDVRTHDGRSEKSVSERSSCNNNEGSASKAKAKLETALERKRLIEQEHKSHKAGAEFDKLLYDRVFVWLNREWKIGNQGFWAAPLSDADFKVVSDARSEFRARSNH